MWLWLKIYWDDWVDEEGERHLAIQLQTNWIREGCFTRDCLIIKIISWN